MVHGLCLYSGRSGRMKFGAVVAAAGMSTRMQGFKQLMTLGGVSLVGRIVRTFQHAGVEKIVVVTGYRSQEVEEALKGRNVVLLRNERYAETEMFDSAKIGLAGLKDQCEHVFFNPVDVPLFTGTTVRKEIQLAGSADVLVPCFRGKAGHPLLLSAEAVRHLLACEGGGGLKGAYEKLAAEGFVRVRHIQVEDLGILWDADTQEDYQKLQKLYREMQEYQDDPAK